MVRMDERYELPSPFNKGRAIQKLILEESIDLCWSHSIVYDWLYLFVFKLHESWLVGRVIVGVPQWLLQVFLMSKICICVIVLVMTMVVVVSRNFLR